MDTINFDDFEYSFETQLDVVNENSIYVLVIYDIADNKNRTRLSKYLQGYGFRIQKSCFEAYITDSLYKRLKKEIGRFVDEATDDSIRIYKIIGKGQVTCYGKQVPINSEDVIII